MMRCAVLLLGFAWSQTVPKEEDLKRYKKMLDPAAAPAKRIEAAKNVAFYDSEPTTRLLIGALTAEVARADELAAKRADVDQQLERALRGQIEKGGAHAKPNYTGIEELQLQQKRCGAAVAESESVIRAYVAALGGLKHESSIDYLLGLPGKKSPRVKLLVLEALGSIDNGKVAEALITLLADDSYDLRVTAAAALLKQKPEFVPASAFAPLLRSEQWPERALAIDALAHIGGFEAMNLLIQQTVKEKGKTLQDLCGRLEQLTAQKFGPVPPAWVDWWKANQSKFPAKGIDVSSPVEVKVSKVDGVYGSSSCWGVQFTSLRVVYVIDISGSMQAAIDDFENIHPEPGKSRFDLVRREVKSSIQGLAPDATFNVIAYSDVVIPWNEGNVVASNDNKKKAFEWLDGLASVGQTNIADALESAFHLSPAKEDGKTRASVTGGGKSLGPPPVADTLLFMSDGGPTCGRTTDCEEILKLVKEWNATRHITIHAIGIGKQVVQVFLARLAKENGGQYLAIEK